MQYNNKKYHKTPQLARQVEGAFIERKAMKDRLIIVRGGGDLATGVVQSLFQVGFRVLILEVDRPSAIRRQVALCEAVAPAAVSCWNRMRPSISAGKK